MLIVWFFVYKKLAQFAVRGALPPRRSESPGCAADNKPSCVLHLLGSFIGSRGFSSLEQRPEFWVLHELHLFHARAMSLARKDQDWRCGDMTSHSWVTSCHFAKCLCLQGFLMCKMGLMMPPSDVLLGSCCRTPLEAHSFIKMIKVQASEHCRKSVKYMK